MNSIFRLKNPNLNEDDNLYHLGLKAKDDLQSRFGDVKYVCTGGKSSRMKSLAEYLYAKMGEPTNSIYDIENSKLCDISERAERYSTFKVGEVLLVSHGIGMASLSVVLNEVFKLLHYAKCNKDVKFIRVGSSGGLDVKPGTLVITNKPYNSALERKFRHISFGEKYSIPCVTSNEMRSKLLETARNLGISAISGNTVSSDDFYEGQCRLDGAFCDYEEEDKMDFLKMALEKFGIKNFEMESTCLAAMCNRANLECAVICATLVDRLKTDVVNVTEEQIDTWHDRLFQVVGEYILADLGRNQLSQLLDE